MIQSSGSGYRTRSFTSSIVWPEPCRSTDRPIDRSTTVRRLLSEGLESNSWLLRTGKGKGRVGEIVAGVAASVRAKGADAAVARARPKAKLAAEIKAHRAREEALEKLNRIGDRIALQSAKTPAPHLRKEPPTPMQKPAGRARRPSEAEVKAAVDRAMARRKEHDPRSAYGVGPPSTARGCVGMRRGLL
jgi:hypothetical protein